MKANHTQRRVHQNSVVELSRRWRDMNSLHLLERTQRMTFGDELVDRTLKQADDNDDHSQPPAVEI
jgi:hypothetical protein